MPIAEVAVTYRTGFLFQFTRICWNNTFSTAFSYQQRCLKISSAWNIYRYPLGALCPGDCSDVLKMSWHLPVVSATAELIGNYYSQ